MKAIRYTMLATAAALCIAVTASATTPTPNGAFIKLRKFNDSPGSIITTTTADPGKIEINDAVMNACGGANLHGWVFSADGGANPASFDNNATYSYACDVTLNSNLPGSEAGLMVSPWYGHFSDGKFMINGGGEIACFGGRLPFYSFTGNYAIHYVKGTTVRMGITYYCNTLNSFNPATIEYTIKVGATTYSSGKLPFDQANPAEDPPHGLWGELNDAYVGGYLQGNPDCGNDQAFMDCVWGDIVFAGGTTPAKTTSWGTLKKQYK